MRYVVKSGGEPPRVITEADGTVRIHIEGQPEVLDLIMTSEQFDVFLRQATEDRAQAVPPSWQTRKSLGHGE